jgi:hypothetical protein
MSDMEFVNYVEGSKAIVSKPSGIDNISVTYPHVTRVELIVNAERREVIYGAKDVFTDLQDDGRTLKVFLNKD